MLRPLRGSNDGPKKRFSDKRLQELQAEGLDVAQIANRLGVRRQAISKLISEVG
jgi:transcriptional regulator with XRE-family HTH domain